MENTQTTKKKNRLGKRGYLLLLAAPTLLATGYFSARAQATDDMLGCGRGHGGSPEQHKAFMTRRLERMLDMVKANDSQRSAIKAIAERTFAEMHAMHEQRGRIHDQLATAITAEPVDRAAIENLRSQLVKMMEQGSQAVSMGLLDAAQILSPEQRDTLVKVMREHHDRRQH